jgi:hypothetical protein
MSLQIDPTAIVNRYFRAVEAMRFRDIVECFTEDAVYVHPPFAWEPPNSEWHVIVGREELYKYFEKRGDYPILHHLQACAVDGHRAFITGLGTDTRKPEDVSAMSYFVSELLLSDEGLIRYYAGFAMFSLPRTEVFRELHPVPRLDEKSG